MLLKILINRILNRLEPNFKLLSLIFYFILFDYSKICFQIIRTSLKTAYRPLINTIDLSNY